MNDLFWWLGQNTIAVAVMIPFVIVACRLLRNRPAIQHVLWVVVLLKFITPPIVAWPWSVSEIRQSVVPDSTATDAVVEAPIEEPTPDLLATGVTSANLDAARMPVTFHGGNEALPQPRELSTASHSATMIEQSLDWERLALAGVAFAWLIGAAFCATWQCRRIVRHGSIVRGGHSAPAQLTDEIGSVARRLGVRPPRTVVSRGVLSPFVWCLGRLRLVWPESLLGADDVVRSRGVIAHELAHVHRRDHWVAWLLLVAGIVWWWNPLFWLVRRRLRESSEMACDALAIATRPDGRREYAELLLRLSSGLKSGAPAPVLAVSAGAPSSFERRLSMILSDRVSGKMSSWGIFAAIAFALIALPGWSLGLPKKPQPVSDSSKPSVADDPLLRELIEQGKFEEAKARMATLKTKQAADKAIADGIFPDKWKEALLKTLPAACVKDHPRDAPLAWTFCMSCHTGLKEPGAVDRKRTYFDVEFTWPPPLPTSDGKSESPWKVDRFRPNELVEDKPLITFEGNKRFYVLSFDTQGAYLVALQSDSQKQVWQSRVIDSPPNRRPEVKWSLVDSNDGKTVTLTSARNEDLINYQLDWSTGKMIQTSKARQQPISGKANEPASPPLSKIEAQSPDGKLLAVTSEAHILLIDRDTGQVIRSIGVDGAANIAGVTFSTDGKLLKRVDKDGATWTIDVATGKILERTAARRPAVIEVEYSQAVANVESARARLARLKGLTDVNKETIDEAAQYLERADRQLQSLVAAVKDAHKLADTSRALAEMEFTRIKELVAKGAATDVQLEAARVKLASAEIQVRRLESILKQGVAITEPMTPPSVTALTTSTRSSSWLKSDSGSVDAQSLNVLDLAERYLRATADVKKAKNRIESMKGSKLAVSQQEANEAKIELEAAEKRVQLLSGFIKDAVNTARAEIATAEEELARVSQLSRKGFVAQTEVDRAKSRVDAARARVKQLETILSTVGMTKPDSTPPM